MIRTNIFLSKPQKSFLEKVAKAKGLSVAELVRRIVDKEADRQKRAADRLEDFIEKRKGR